PPAAATPAPAPAPAPVTPIAPPPAAAPPSVTAPPAAEPSVVSTSVGPGGPPESTPIYKRWWLWTAIGVVAVGAVVAAVALSSGGSTTPWNNVDPVMAGAVRR